jgi:hypothetical protein
MSVNAELDRQVDYVAKGVADGAAPFVEGGRKFFEVATRKENQETGERAGFLRTLYDVARMKAARAIYRRRMMRVNRPGR